MRLIAMLFALLMATVATVAAAAPVDLAVNHYPFTKVKISLDGGRLDHYQRLASAVGLDYDRVYSYREFSDAKRKKDIGAAGQYEFLLLSTGGNSNNAEDDMRAMKAPLHWEMVYYRNINMTIIHAVKNEGDSSSVKLIKLERGRVPDLHLR